MNRPLSLPSPRKAGRGVPIWFMAPIHVRFLEVFVTHEPPIGARTAMSARIKSKELADKAVRAPFRRRLMAPTHVQILEVLALHEPPPHPIPLPLGGGEGARRAGEGVVHGPNACEKRKEAFHEPPLSRPSATLSPPCGERAGRGVPIWFMVPMYAQKRMKASHAPAPSPLHHCRRIKPERFPRALDRNLTFNLQEPKPSKITITNNSATPHDVAV